MVSYIKERKLPNCQLQTRQETSDLSITKKKIGNCSAVDCKQDSKLPICQLQNKTGNFRIVSSKNTGYFRTVMEFINYSPPPQKKTSELSMNAY
jgi:hypothetical protein